MSLPAVFRALGSGARSKCSSMSSPLPSRFAIQTRCVAHTVRVILTEDLPNSKAYKGDVVHVKAGHARNHLIPNKYALYATAENFKRLEMKDPDMETEDQRQERLAREAMSDEGAEELKAADILKHYLRNKVLKIYRKVDPETEAVSPGMVDALALRQKLSKQLKIDLEKHEKIHIREDPLKPEEMTEETLLGMVEEMDTSKKCEVQIRKLGDFVARISLAGGYAVPLKFKVVRT